MEISETALINHLEYIKKICEETKGRSIELIHKDTARAWGYDSLCSEVDSIIREYNWIVPSINSFLKENNFSFQLSELKFIKCDFKKMKEENVYPSVDKRLVNISLKCNRILSIIKNMFTSTKESKKNFEEVKKEIKDIEKNIPTNVLRDIYEAIGELELDKKLGAVLICGRIIIFHLDLIPGNINQKIEKIKEMRILETRGSTEWIIKAEKKARDLFVHDLNDSPSPSDAISILGDMIKIVKIVTEYKIKTSK